MKAPFDEGRALRVVSHLAPSHPTRSPWRRDLHRGQSPVFQRAFKRFILKWGRRTGKSHTLTAWLCDGWQHYPNETSVFIAQTQGHAYRILWKTLIRFDQKYQLGLKLDESKLTATFPNGYQIWLTGCSTLREAEKIRGARYRRVAIDEAGTIASDLLEYLIDDVIDPALMDLDGELALSGTPGVIPKGYFYERCTGIGEQGPVASWPMFESTCLDNPYVNGGEYIRQKLAEKGWTESNSTFRREYLGQWVVDLDSIIYPFVGNRNGFAGADLPTNRGRHRSIISVDIGWHHDTAIIVSTSHRGHPDVWFRSAWKSPHLLLGRIAMEVERRRQPLLAAGDSIELVIDSGGSGSKNLAEELKATYGLPFTAAEKRDKQLGIERLRDGLAVGTVHADPIECAALIGEWHALPYNDARTDHHEQYPDHCADGALYGYRRHLLAYRPEHEPPRPGSEEWNRRERAAERLAAQKRAKGRGRAA